MKKKYGNRHPAEMETRGLSVERGLPSARVEITEVLRRFGVPPDTLNAVCRGTRELMLTEAEHTRLLRAFQAAEITSGYRVHDYRGWR